MNDLKQMLRDHATNAETPPIRNAEQLLRAAASAAKDTPELRAVLRNAPVGAVANVMLELDGVADVLRRAASTLRNLAEGELRRKDDR